MPEATPTRSERIEQHIQESGLFCLLANLTMDGWEHAPLYGLYDYSELCEIADRMESWDNYRTLWPEDEDQDKAECLLANARVKLLVTRIFTALADNPDYLRERASHFADLAERDTAKLAALGTNGSATTS